MNPPPQEELQAQLNELIGTLMTHAGRFVRGNALVRAKALADLCERMAKYAAKGDQTGMEFIYGRACGELLDLKLDVEDKFTDILKIIGAFALDAASSVLPRMIDRLAPFATKEI